MEEELLRSNCGDGVSTFDYSVENYFKAIDSISKLCEEPESDSLNESEIQRLSSSVTFLREWKYFSYEPRNIKFANEMGSCGEKEVLSEINLPQFSSAAVPKKEGLYGHATSLDSSKDYVMYVGGSVWALDWCPRVHKSPDCLTKCEFLAVAAHPPESYYHKLGVPLVGRGIVQIWCMLNVSVNEEPPVKKNPKRGPQNDEANESKKPRGRPKKKPVDESLEATQLKRPRGRPRKSAIDESIFYLDDNDEFVQALAVQYPENSSTLISIQGVSGNTEEHAVQEKDGKKQISSTKRASSNSARKPPRQSRKLKNKASEGRYSEDICLPLLTLNEDEGASMESHHIHHRSGQASAPKGIVLPRVVLCLAHNGKVAWDVKWRPYNENDPRCKQRMGYLAVVLGNGSIEVWEVPLPRTIGVIYSSLLKEDTDPRFVKLEPVFRCSMLKCGGIQSIPLTVEWSTSPPHDYLLAGCHDGTVALWKFSASGSSCKDTKPLLRFSADTVPIRAVSWAPMESDMESTNVILTAGHGGLKFWDIRDPFRPLWDLHPVPRFIYALDWLPDPRCVFLSYDDGAMRVLSLVKAAYDVPATGKPFAGTKQQGLHLYGCSSFAIWSIQVSRLTGMVAYCSADGTVFRSQLTNKAVEKDPSRNRAPHFVCGSLTEDNSAITVNTPLPDTPLPFKKQTSAVGDNRTIRSISSESNPTKTASDKKGKKVSNLNNQSKTIARPPDSDTEYDSDVTLAAALTRKKEPKSRSNSKKKAEDSLAIVCRVNDDDEEASNIQGKENEKGEVGKTIEVLPSKLVAMHRVRWNMNKGSERWLCYGGAAGIVRCQEIIAPRIEMKTGKMIRN